MKRQFAGLFAEICAGICTMTLVSLIAIQSPVQAQMAAGQTHTTETTKVAGPFGYDVSQEVTLNGTVSSVLAKPSRGMIMGSHLLLATPSGLVDASLGRFGLRGKGALSVTAGEQVEVTGVMKTIKDRQVFLARTVKVGDEVYTVRNKHGFPVPPQARERANHSNAGDSL
jgi:hypothetical protein